VAIFKDNGESSYSFDGLDFNALEDFIKKNKNVNVLVVMELARFSGNLAEALMKTKELHNK
jgi:site-specific DNA recombinase